MNATDKALLDTYAAHATEWKAGERMQALRDVSGLSSTRTAQRVVRLLEDPAAWEYAPATMGLIRRRLTRGRAERSVTRSA